MLEHTLRTQTQEDDKEFIRAIGKVKASPLLGDEHKRLPRLRFNLGQRVKCKCSDDDDDWQPGQICRILYPYVLSNSHSNLFNKLEIHTTGRLTATTEIGCHT